MPPLTGGDHTDLEPQEVNPYEVILKSASHLLLFGPYLGRVSFHIPGCPGAHYVAQVDLAYAAILLPQSSKRWVSRNEPPHPGANMGCMLRILYLKSCGSFFQIWEFFLIWGSFHRLF